MEWLLAIAVIVATLVILPWAVGSMKRSGRGGGSAAGVGFALTEVFDPAKAAAVVTIEQKKEIGDIEDREAGDLRD